MRLLVALSLAPCLFADIAADARAIIGRRCAGCHNAKTKTAGLDLATRDAPLARGPGFLLARVMSGKMPPGAPLPDHEKETLRQWLSAGAGWWSLQPLGNHTPPAASAIDGWIGARLQANGLTPSPPADRRTLIRRVTFDLLGLPPSPEEVEAFVNDKRPNAWEALLDRLLASPQYGEQWARHWMDVVRFAESEGFERDWLRDNAWTYRDYLIRAFNSDMPYTQFAREQIAGDVLEPVTHHSIAATGLLVLGPFDAVGLTSAVPQERELVREDQLEEMVGAVSQTFLGLTVNCARCHDHKFDPIPQKDYYRFKAALEGVWQPVVDDDLKADGRPLLTPAEKTERTRRILKLESQIAAAEDELARIHRSGKRPENHAAAQWTFDWDTRDEVAALHARYSKSAAVADGRLTPAAGKDSVTVSTVPLASDLREKTLEAWIHVRNPPAKAVTLFRIRNRSGFRGAASDAIHYAGGQEKQWENQSAVRFRSRNVKGVPEDTAAGGRVHVAITYSTDGTIRLYRNGIPYGIPYQPDPGLAAGRLQTYAKDDAIVDLTSNKDLELEEARFYSRALSEAEVKASFDAWQPGVSVAPEANRPRIEELKRQIAAARGELEAIPAPPKAFAADTKNPAPTHILIRGDVNRRGEIVSPGGVSSIAGAPGDFQLPPDASDSQRRRALAEWIASPSNPLFARVMVNRVWHHHFGTGLVENPNDFGYNGGQPSHPELLDWLAQEFARNGWSVKKLHKTILLSQAYQRSSTFQSEAAAKDADNRLLWRFSPGRLPGESVRDAMLAASGMLNAKLYGPSFRPFEIVRNAGSYATYKPVDSDDAELQRRTLYRMSVNSGGNPMLESLDCPLPSVKTPRRLTTTTALQALSLMNNAFVHRLAKAFAARLTREAAATAARVDRAFRLALGRPPRPEEAESGAALVSQYGLEALCWGLFNTSEFLYAR